MARATRRQVSIQQVAVDVAAILHVSRSEVARLRAVARVDRSRRAGPRGVGRSDWHLLGLSLRRAFVHRRRRRWRNRNSPIKSSPRSAISREPDAACEGCGARGTVGRATRTAAAGEPVEEHRYCARCWPEWSNREPPSAEWLSQVADAI